MALVNYTDDTGTLAEILLSFDDATVVTGTYRHVTVSGEIAEGEFLITPTREANHPKI
jgi:hypothetical protein